VFFPGGCLEAELNACHAGGALLGPARTSPLAPCAEEGFLTWALPGRQQLSWWDVQVVVGAEPRWVQACAGHESSRRGLPAEQPLEWEGLRSVWESWVFSLLMDLGVGW